MERTLEIPVSVNPTDAIRAMRIIGEESGWQMSRIEETKIVQRLSLIHISEPTRRYASSVAGL